MSSWFRLPARTIRIMKSAPCDAYHRIDSRQRAGPPTSAERRPMLSRIEGMGKEALAAG
jgi:hypothetical protein